MTEQEKKLLLVDLCARLPYGVIMNTPNGDGHLCSINRTIFGNEYGINISATRRDYFNDEKLNFKPYLRSRSSMTKEERNEYHSYCDCYYGIYFDTVGSIDWLNKKMFDYRKYDEGKTMIEKGFALEAPDGMYNLEKK